MGSLIAELQTQLEKSRFQGKENIWKKPEVLTN